MHGKTARFERAKHPGEKVIVIMNVEAKAPECGGRLKDRKILRQISDQSAVPASRVQQPNGRTGAGSCTVLQGCVDDAEQMFVGDTLGAFQHGRRSDDLSGRENKVIAKKAKAFTPGRKGKADHAKAQELP